MKIRLADGTEQEIDGATVVEDQAPPGTGLNPTPPPGTQYFTAEDMARARSEEKNKLYGTIEELKNTSTASLAQIQAFNDAAAETAATQKAAEDEAARIEAEKDLDAKALLDKRQQEWQHNLDQVTQTWEKKFADESQARERAEAVTQREREFNDLREYAQSQAVLNQDKIAPQLIPWITGNTKEEIDAAITRAVTTTDEIAKDLQAVQESTLFTPGQYQAPQVQSQVLVPPLPGTRVTSGPVGTDPAADVQQLTPDQIKNMPMEQFSKLRGRLGIGGQSNNRGMFG